MPKFTRIQPASRDRVGPVPSSGRLFQATAPKRLHLLDLRRSRANRKPQEFGRHGVAQSFPKQIHRRHRIASHLDGSQRTLTNSGARLVKHSDQIPAHRDTARGIGRRVAGVTSPPHPLEFAPDPELRFHALGREAHGRIQAFFSAFGSDALNMPDAPILEPNDAAVAPERTLLDSGASRDLDP